MRSAGPSGPASATWYTVRMLRYSLKARAAVLAAFLASLALGPSAAAQTGGKNFLWKVQKGAAVLYLAGSVHALSADVYPLPAAYQRAFDASDTLVEELDFNEAGIGALAPAM